MVSEVAKARAPFLGQYLADRRAALLAKGYVVSSPDAIARGRAAALAALDAPDTRADRFFEAVEDGPRYSVPERLRFPSRMASESTLALHDRADWRYTPPDLRYLGARVCEVLRKQGIPFFVPHAGPNCVQFAHVVFGAALTPLEWSLVHAVVVDIALNKRIPVKAGDSPAFFHYLGPPLVGPFSSEPVRRTPRGILTAMRGR